MAAAPVNPNPANRPRQAEPEAAKAKAAKPPKPARQSPWQWGLPTRVLVTVLVLFHLAAVFSMPWRIQLRGVMAPDLPPGAQPRDAQGRAVQITPQRFPPVVPRLPETLSNFFKHYANLLYLNNGYDFFSPDPPGEGHVLRYRLYDDKNQKIAEGEIPNRQQQWPRLFYHRHMMLADQSFDPDLAGVRWETRIAKHLMESHDADRIEMEFLVHHLLTPAQVAAGERLDAPSTYERVGQMSQRRSDQLPPLPRTAAPLPGPQPGQQPGLRPGGAP